MTEPSRTNCKKKGEYMTNVLQLQRLRTTIGTDLNIVLISTYSGICPANTVDGNPIRFEME